jgi:Asp-tRNA(Asn)/Glu-tRNA(Gln) amidotransferase A subunit family amidase
MARTVTDAALLFEAMGGSVATPLRPAAGPRTFGVPVAYFCDKLQPGVRAALDRVRRDLAAAGHRVIDVAVAHAEWTADVYLHIVLPEAAAFHAPMLDAHAGA